jgi:hypothetical protein
LCGWSPLKCVAWEILLVATLNPSTTSNWGHFGGTHKFTWVFFCIFCIIKMYW